MKKGNSNWILLLAVLMLLVAVGVGRTVEARMGQGHPFISDTVQVYRTDDFSGMNRGYDMKVRAMHQGDAKAHEGLMILTWLALMAFLVSGTMFFLSARNREYKK